MERYTIAISVLVPMFVVLKLLCIKLNKTGDQFLMGLNEVHIVVRGSLLMMSLLPTIAQSFSILIQEEK